MESYVWALDLSMSNTGLAVFNDNNDTYDKPVLITSVETKPSKTDGERLKIIADFLLELKEKYPPKLLVIENGFYRFAKSTEVVFMVHGVVRYLFSSVKQIFYAPTTVKKTVGGKGNLKKEELRDVIKEKYSEIETRNYDESDAFAIGLTYFMKNKGEENG